MEHFVSHVLLCKSDLMDLAGLLLIYSTACADNFRLQKRLRQIAGDLM